MQAFISQRKESLIFFSVNILLCSYCHFKQGSRLHYRYQNCISKGDPICVKFKNTEIHVLATSLTALTKCQQKNKGKKLDVVIVVQKTNQQTFIENLCILSTGYLNLNKIYFLPSGVHSPI